MPNHHSGPTRVVLLSDGTGNSSAKLMKTNVWRMYQALDCRAGDQVAFYDNGIGTSSFTPFAVLGGALGWGLKRNVLSLYRFACQNYRLGGGGDMADAIYAFGFSRGAFTVRVLIGLIDSQGLIPGVKGRELERRARWAYRAYRRQFNPTGGLVAPLRGLRDRLLRLWERKPAYDSTHNVRPRVAFVGLWDTVDAYGLPIDEMTRGWDQWVWPLSLPTHACPAIVERACHAIALDDERHTFHPVLFDESSEPVRATIHQERVTQVWFSGVHSNVGGGYPDDSLAHVPLCWMADQACSPGQYLPLRLHPHMRHEWDGRLDPNGPIVDSRRGLGVYYRYNPRHVQRLTDDRFEGVRVPMPKFHESVFWRIAAGRDDYAPIVLPERYAVVTSAGAILDPAANPFEHTTQAASRCADQERAWDLVWKRRIAYFATVILTFLLIVPPFLFGADGGGILPWKSRALSALVQTLGMVLPDMAQPWVGYYQEYPVQLLVGGIVLALLLAFSTSLQHAIGDQMRAVWDEIALRPGTPVPAPAPPASWIYHLRTHRLYRRTFEVATQHLFPFVFGVGALVAVVLVIAGSVNRAVFAGVSAAGRVCRDVAPARWDGAARPVTLPSNELCLATGLVLQPGETYRVTVASVSGDWADRPLALLPALPFRRILTAPWFVPMVRVGATSAEYHPLDEATVEFSPRVAGQLFLFVNDAVGPAPWFKAFYANNHGTAVIEVRRVSR